MATTTDHHDISLSTLLSQSPPSNVSIVRFVNKPSARRKYKYNLSNFPAAGILLAILSSFFFSIAYLLVKIVESADPILFVINRGYFQLFTFVAVAVYKGQSLKDVLNRKTVLCLTLTGLFGAAQQITSFYAIKYIPIADGTAVLLSAPVFVSIFACVFLKEKCGVFQVVTVLLALVGVILVCRPTFLFGDDLGDSSSKDFSDRVLGFSLIFVGCILMAAMYITLRKASDVPFAITNATMAVFSIVVALAFSLISGKDFKQPKCGWDSAFVVSSAVLGTFGMLLFVLATQIEHAGPVSVARTSEIVFAFVWQMAALGVIPSWTSLLGATIVVSAVALIGFQKWAASRQDGKFTFESSLTNCASVCPRNRAKNVELSHKLNEIDV